MSEARDPLTPEESARIRRAGEWVICGEVRCDNPATFDLMHLADDGQRIWVPLCDYHIAHSSGLEYQLETHGFFLHGAK